MLALLHDKAVVSSRAIHGVQSGVTSFRRVHFLARYEDIPGVKIRYIQIAADPEKSRVTCTT